MDTMHNILSYKKAASDVFQDDSPHCHNCDDSREQLFCFLPTYCTWERVPEKAFHFNKVENIFPQTTCNTNALKQTFEL